MMRGAVWMLAWLPLVALADGPTDNLADKVRRVPPPGVKIDESARVELQKGVDEFGKAIDELQKSLKDKPNALELLPDVQIFHIAVKNALQYDEFYNVKEVDAAQRLLKVGMQRLAELKAGKPTWPSATGAVVRGYISKIDGSIQPYGLIVPASYSPITAHRYRLDFWCHGRGEQLTELNFVSQRLGGGSEFVPPNGFMLHLYGRYCCANKFAGEVDLLEAMEHAKKHYPIDENRMVVRGFSMGGAACWQFAVHYPSLFVAAAPGAGFSETPEFLRVFQKETVQPTDYERKLFRLYDCPGYCRNLLNLPTVAYSGDKDSQKQAADIMATALEAEGMSLTHIIGPNTAHSYNAKSKIEINRRIDSIVERGRNPVPESVSFTTYTLRYPRSYWVQIDGLKQHWERGRVEARIVDNRRVVVKTEGVTALTLSMPAGYCPLDPAVAPQVEIDGRMLTAAKVESDQSWSASFHQGEGGWKVGAMTTPELRKRPELQGPIDDAFWDSFIVVRPTGTTTAPTAKWVTGEMEHAIEHWRRQFRGEARQKKDTEITDADIASSNLILFGDPQSNSILAKISEKLPIQWGKDMIRVGGKEFPTSDHVVLAIYPNPLNPKRYVVLNSGITFREYDYLNNARQIPKLPDYAIVDTRGPVTARAPGKIALAGFFNEAWQLGE